MLNNIAGFLGTGVAAATTSFESIATVTVGAGGSSSISFSSIPSTFKHLQIRMLSSSASGGHTLSMQLNNDTSSNYTFHRLEGDGSSAAAAAGTGRSNIAFGVSQAANGWTATVLDLLDYTSTNKKQTIRSLTGNDNNGSGSVGLYSGLYNVTPAAISTIKIYIESGYNFAQYSSFALYGIKG